MDLRGGERKKENDRESAVSKYIVSVLVEGVMMYIENC
jgi:hypothetical protein